MSSGISIIIPHFNRSKIIYETLKSIENQSVKNWEVIVVDDGSDQLEFEQLQCYQSLFPNTTILQRTAQYKKGANACRNIGIEKSQYNSVIFLDSDDLLSPNCIENRLEHADLSADMAIFNMQRFSKKPGDSGRIVNKYHEIISAAALLDYFLIFKLPWPITSVLWKKSFLKDLLFDEELIRFQDVEIHIRALLKSPKLCLYPHKTPDCYYRNSDYDFTLTQEKAKSTLNAGFYLINKITPKLSNQQRIKFLGFLYFIIRTFAIGINLKNQRIALGHYFKLSGKANSINGLFLVFLSNKYLINIPGINYIRQRCFVYGRKQL